MNYVDWLDKMDMIYKQGKWWCYRWHLDIYQIYPQLVKNRKKLL